jgi:Protein of unknown function (DUF1344)
MSRSIVVVLTLTLVLAAPAVWAADIEGKIQSIDAGERSLTLDNGTKIWLAEGVAVDAVKEGAEVTVSYEERDGKPVATSVEMK